MQTYNYDIDLATITNWQALTTINSTHTAYGIKADGNYIDISIWRKDYEGMKIDKSIHIDIAILKTKDPSSK